MTEWAVQKHATNIFRKLGLAESSEDHRRVLAVLTFLNAWRAGRVSDRAPQRCALRTSRRQLAPLALAPRAVIVM
jgi:hypothetical protein